METRRQTSWETFVVHWVKNFQFSDEWLILAIPWLVAASLQFSLPSSHGCLLCVPVAPNLSLLRKTLVVGFKVHPNPVWSYFNLIIPAKSLFPNKVTFSWNQGLGLQYIFLRDTIQPITVGYRQSHWDVGSTSSWWVSYTLQLHQETAEDRGLQRAWRGQECAGTLKACLWSKSSPRLASLPWKVWTSQSLIKNLAHFSLHWVTDVNTKDTHMWCIKLIIIGPPALMDPLGRRFRSCRRETIWGNGGPFGAC